LCPGEEVFFDSASCELDAEGKSTGCVYSLKETASGGRQGHCDPAASGRRLQAGYNMMLMEFWSDQWKADVRGAIHRLCVQVYMPALICFAPSLL
jgi:hypothetical protein